MNNKLSMLKKIRKNKLDCCEKSVNFSWVSGNEKNSTFGDMCFFKPLPDSFIKNWLQYL